MLEPAKIRIRWIWILYFKYVGFSICKKNSDSDNIRILTYPYISRMHAEIGTACHVVLREPRCLTRLFFLRRRASNVSGIFQVVGETRSLGLVHVSTEIELSFFPRHTVGWKFNEILSLQLLRWPWWETHWWRQRHNFLDWLLWDTGYRYVVYDVTNQSKQISVFSYFTAESGVHSACFILILLHRRWNWPHVRSGADPVKKLGWAVLRTGAKF